MAAGAELYQDFQNCLKTKNSKYARLREHMQVQRYPNTDTNTKIPKYRYEYTYKYKDIQYNRLRKHLTQVVQAVGAVALVIGQFLSLSAQMGPGWEW